MEKNIQRMEEPSFWKFVEKTIQRYEESNLKIESLRLYVVHESWLSDCDSINELILRCLKMGATQINLRIRRRYFVLSPDVFEAEKLVRLSVEGCTVDLDLMEDPRVIRCSGLKFLSLSGVKIKRFDRIPNLISSFSLIEKLSLSDTKDGSRHFSVRQPLNFQKLHNLRSLVISFVKGVDPLVFGDLSSNFPSLKDLTLHLNDFVENVLISSRSLERLSFRMSTWHWVAQKMKMVTFDVPSIRVFTYIGSIIPSFYFKSSPSREWESRLSITRGQKPSTSWFLGLNKLLLELSPSKIHLSLHVQSKRSFDYEVKHMEGLSKPVLENLTMDSDGLPLPSLTCYALVDALFRLCRPKIITQYVPRKSSFRDDFLCKTLALEMDGKCSSSRCIRCLHDLKKVFVQVFDKDVAVWRDLPWKDFLNASASRKFYQKMCFHLRWKL